MCWWSGRSGGDRPNLGFASPDGDPGTDSPASTTLARGSPSTLALMPRCSGRCSRPWRRSPTATPSAITSRCRRSSSRAGAVGFEPDLHETVYPLVAEMLYAVALAFRGPVACRLVSGCSAWSSPLNVAALARPALGRRARWAATVALLVPGGLQRHGGAAERRGPGGVRRRGAASPGSAGSTARPPGSRPWPGLLAGLALGVKYPGAGLVGLARRLGDPSAGRDLAARRAVDPAHVAVVLRAGRRCLVGGGLVSCGPMSTPATRSTRSSARSSAARGSTRCSTRSSGRWPSRPGTCSRPRADDARARPVRQLRPPVRAGVPAVPAGPVPAAAAAAGGRAGRCSAMRS